MTDAPQPVLADIDARGVASLTLNRPGVGNAYNDGMIQGLLAAMRRLSAEPNLRAVVLKGNGRHFQAGADLKWIAEVSRASAEENERVSRATAEAVDRLNRLAVPTVALDWVAASRFCWLRAGRTTRNQKTTTIRTNGRMDSQPLTNIS